MLKFNQGQIKISIIFLIGLSLGWLGCLVVGDNKTSYQIGYISKEEILNLEKARVVKASELNLFKGKAAFSANLINKIGRLQENKNLKVIFTSEAIVGEGVISLSKKVHEETIKQLEKLKEPENVPQEVIPVESREVVKLKTSAIIKLKKFFVLWI